MTAGSKCGYPCLLTYFEKFFNVMAILYYTNNNITILLNQ